MNSTSENPPTGTIDLLKLDSLHYDYALEHSNIGFWEWDMLTGKIYHSNQSKLIYELYEDHIEFDRYDWKSQIHPEDLPQVEKYLEDHLNDFSHEYKSEHRIKTRDSSFKWVLDQGKIVAYDDQKRPVRFVGTTIDITQRKQDDERLTQNLSVMTNQNKKLSNFAHIVTHNLKEHAGNFESLLNFYGETNSESERKVIINHLQTVSESLTKTIENLKEIVSKQLNTKLDRKPLNVNFYVNKIIGLLELDFIEKKAVVNNNLSDDLFLYSNEAYLESIILNLASNAIKYSHPERTLILSIDSIITDESITIKLSDNGIGIDLEKYGKDIFGLYKTFHSNENAEGIGLYITKNQVEAVGAEIEVESKVNEGTTFIISTKQKKAR